MRGFYDLPQEGIVRVLRAPVSLEHIRIEDRSSVSVALDAFESGLDFADALHLVRSRDASVFVTFDRRLAKRAAKQSLMPPVEILLADDTG